MHLARIAENPTPPQSECEQHRILEYVGLKAKVYSLAMHQSAPQQLGVRKLKGVPKAAVRQRCNHSLYVSYLHATDVQTVSYRRFDTTPAQRVRTVLQSKKALSQFDSKRRFCRDPYSTRAFGHYRDADGDSDTDDEQLQ